MAGPCIALIVSAGRGRRFGGEIPKQYRTLDGRPVLRHTLAAFAAHPGVDAVRAVIHPDDRDLYDQAAEGLGCLEPVPGGESRQDSVRLGLESLEGLAPSLVLIHDGARPFVDVGTISRTIAALSHQPGALPCIPVADTLKRAKADRVVETVDRSGLWRAQTPQGFRFAEILAAHKAVAGEDLTDDAAVAERAGMTVAVVPGSDDNVKITTLADLERAERRLDGPRETRMGLGADVHAFGEGSAVTLCGVQIPHDKALTGHSDADVALHAVTDALLGAIGAGDIGRLFPPSDDTWKGAPSRLFVERAMALIAARGGKVINVDVTLVCETPKIGPHRQAMVLTLAEILDISADRVSVKATTTEGLGFTGRSEGIAAQAVASVALPG